MYIVLDPPHPPSLAALNLQLTRQTASSDIKGQQQIKDTKCSAASCLFSAAPSPGKFQPTTRSGCTKATACGRGTLPSRTPRSIGVLYQQLRASGSRYSQQGHGSIHGRSALFIQLHSFKDRPPCQQKLLVPTFFAFHHPVFVLSNRIRRPSALARRPLLQKGLMHVSAMGLLLANERASLTGDGRPEWT